MDTLFPTYPKIVHCIRDPYDKYVGRRNPKLPEEDGKYGNPFIVGDEYGRGEAVRAYELWLPHHPNLIAHAKVELTGKTLGCWCAPKGGVHIDQEPVICHGVILARAIRGDYDGIVAALRLAKR